MYYHDYLLYYLSIQKRVFFHFFSHFAQKTVFFMTIYYIIYLYKKEYFFIFFPFCTKNSFFIHWKLLLL